MKNQSIIYTTTVLLFLVQFIGLHTVEAKSSKGSNSPFGFSYQAVLRTPNGTPLANIDVTLKLSVQTETDDSGTLQWEETHAVSTNDFGMLNVIVGQGIRTDGVQSSFSNIVWGDSEMFLKVEVDHGSGFIELGVNQLYSVPYALSAANGITEIQSQKLSGISSNAEQNVQSDWLESDNSNDGFIQNKPSIPIDVSDLTDDSSLLVGGFSGDFTDLSNVPADLVDGDDVDDADADASNEIQDLDLTGNILTITNNGSATSIDLSPYLDNTDTDTQLTEAEVDAFVANNGYLTSFTEVDGDASNEIQDLKFNAGVISLTNDPTATNIDLSNYDTDATDDFSGSYNDLTNLPANLDTDATDDFDGDYNSLTNKPNILKYLGMARGKVDGNMFMNPNNEIPTNTATSIKWLNVSGNYVSSIGGVDNITMTIPAGVSFIRIVSSIIYQAPVVDGISTFTVQLNGNVNTLGNAGYMTYQNFNSKYGLNHTSTMIPVVAGDEFEIVLQQNSGASIYLSWGSISTGVSFEFYGY